MEDQIKLIQEKIYRNRPEECIGDVVTLFENILKESTDNSTNAIQQLMSASLSAMENKDFVLLGDILEYELLPLISETNFQSSTWSGDFGKKYIERNDLTSSEMDELYLKRYGLKRIVMNERFLNDIDRNAKILEVGSNVGNQVNILLQMGFKDITVVDVQEDALEILKNNYPQVKCYQADASNLPFEDDVFDLVYTSGVLIHIHPDLLPKVMGEIYRVSNQYIWGMEYYNDKMIAIDYRGRKDLLWKGDYARLYVNQFPDLVCVKEKIYPYLNEPVEDKMYLLKKDNK